MASRHFALLAICASLAANGIAQADVTFTITLLETTETTELVRISPEGTNPPGDCVPEGVPFCFNSEWNFTVSPSPAHPVCIDPCDWGWLQTYHAVTLSLRRGQTYTFEGSLRTQVGIPDQSPCEFTCTDVQAITPRTYETAPLPVIIPEWDVSVVSTENDIVWVDIRMINTSALNKCDLAGGCKVAHLIVCDVTPCPPIVPTFCQGSNTVATGSVDDVFRFGLAAGTTYSISGSLGTRAYFSEEEGGCQYVGCWSDEYPLVKTYKATSVTVTPTTWGHVKSLYRAP